MSASKLMGFADSYGRNHVLFDESSLRVYPYTDNDHSLGSQTKRFLVNEYRPVLSIANWVGGNALASSTAETSLLAGATGKGVGTVGTIAAGNLNRIGAELRYTAWGVMGNTGTPDLTIKFKLGSDITLTLTGTMATITTSKVWRLDVVLTVLTTGATGTCRAQATLFYGTTAIAGVTWNGTDGGAITADFTVAKAIALTGTWSASSSSNTISHTNSNALLAA